MNENLRALEQMAETLRALLLHLPNQEQVARLKREKKEAVEKGQFNRVDAIAREILPTLSPDELKRLDDHIRQELDEQPSKPAHRPNISIEEHKKLAETAHTLHAILMEPHSGFSSEDADELVGFLMITSKRTAQRYRKAHAEKLSPISPEDT